MIKQCDKLKRISVNKEDTENNNKGDEQTKKT